MRQVGRELVWGREWMSQCPRRTQGQTVDSGTSPNRGFRQGYWSPRVSNGTQKRVRSSLQISSGAASGSLDSSPGSQDARRGASSFARTELWRGGTPPGGQQGCLAFPTGDVAQSGVKSSPRLRPGAEPAFRDLNPMSQAACVAGESLVRRGSLSRQTPVRSQQGFVGVLVGDGAHARVGLPLSLPPGGVRVFQDPRKVTPPPSF